METTGGEEGGLKLEISAASRSPLRSEVGSEEAEPAFRRGVMRTRPDLSKAVLCRANLGRSFYIRPEYLATADPDIGVDLSGRTLGGLRARLAFSLFRDPVRA